MGPENLSYQNKKHKTVLNEQFGFFLLVIFQMKENPEL